MFRLSGVLVTYTDDMVSFISLLHDILQGSNVVVAANSQGIVKVS